MRLLDRRVVAGLVRGVGMLAVAACAMPALAGGVQEVSGHATVVQTQRIVWPGRHVASPFTPRGPGGSCAPVTTSVANGYASLDTGSEMTLQAGMVENEGFGSTYTVADPVPGGINDAFPIEINTVEFMAGTAATVSGSDGTAVRLGWTLDVWDGEPNVGTSSIVFSVESDPDPSSTGLPGDLLIQRVPNVQACSQFNVLLGGASVSVLRAQFSVDQTADPVDRMIVPGNATDGAGNKLNTFTIVVRITRHNVPSAGCSSVDLCQNAFFATEAASLAGADTPSRDWLDAVPCPGGCPNGYTRFSNLSSSCRPSHDVLQQVTYTPAFCVGAATGACCATSGACTSTTSSACFSPSVYQGDNVSCTPTPCPQTTGSCCATSGVCTVTTGAGCTGTFTANGSCNPNPCPQPTAACCFGASCLTATATDCEGAGGTFQGAGNACNAGACPTGACCITSTGACSVATPAACSAQGGVYRGAGVVCSTTACPLPTGACCANNGFCLASQTQADCTNAGLSWRGGGSVCSPSPCNSGVCCRGSTCATGISQANCTSPGTNVGAAFVGAANACNGSGATASPCCYADFNKQNGLTALDIFDFLNAWFALSPYCIVGGDGTPGQLSAQNIFDFLNAWFAGGC